MSDAPNNAQQQPPEMAGGAQSPPGMPQNSVYNHGYAPPPPPEQKVRRVGTFTMALCLIAVGVLLVAKIFVPAISVIALLRFSPIVLVFLGLEILFSNFRFREYKLKYDLLSVFICLLLIGGSLTVAVVPEWVQRRYTAMQVEQRLQQQLITESERVLHSDSIASMDAYLEVNQPGLKEDLTLQGLKPEDYVQIRVYYTGQFKSAEDFAQACKKTLDTLQSVAPHFDYASFYSISDEQAAQKDGQVQYILTLDSIFQQSWPPQQLADIVETLRWDEENQNFYYEDTYQNMLKNRREGMLSDAASAPGSTATADSSPEQAPEPPGSAAASAA